MQLFYLRPECSKGGLHN